MNKQSTTQQKNEQNTFLYPSFSIKYDNFYYTTFLIDLLIKVQ